ncbi:hypothetical protein ACHZ97_09730 [Lysobacter soli]|uniref:hypothetical protein n=1 Tax=Lysobacter soli TaxID=453783 RepID=UPI0037C88C07
MRLLLSDAMIESRTVVVDRLAHVSILMKGKEPRKLKVRRNGLCLLIALAIEAKLDRPTF